MSTSLLRSTQFRVLKLRSNGSDGRAAPYQVTTFRGRKLGIVGTLPEIQIPTSQEAANQVNFEHRSPTSRNSSPR